MTAVKTQLDAAKAQIFGNSFIGIHREVGTPGSIPNPEVKHLIANDTAHLYVGK